MMLPAKKTQILNLKIKVANLNLKMERILMPRKRRAYSALIKTLSKKNLGVQTKSLSIDSILVNEMQLYRRRASFIDKHLERFCLESCFSLECLQVST